MPNIGPMELIIVLVIVLVIFGPKRLPGLGRQLGSGMREFKDSIASKTSKDDDDEAVTSGRTLSAPPAPEPVATPASTSVRVDEDAVVPTPATPPAARRDARRARARPPRHRPPEPCPPPRSSPSGTRRS